MTLDEALSILARCHTRDDYQIGFVVYNSANMFACSQREYIDAWRAVREHLHLPTEMPNAT